MYMCRFLGVVSGEERETKMFLSQVTFSPRAILHVLMFVCLTIRHCSRRRFRRPRLQFIHHSSADRVDSGLKYTCEHL